MIDFVRALTALIRALVPLVEERVRHARLERIRQQHALRVAQVLDDPAAAFAALDDELRAAGLAPARDSGGAESGETSAERRLSGDAGVDGASDAGAARVASGAR